jgi:hypothetical protein
MQRPNAYYRDDIPGFLLDPKSNKSEERKPIIVILDKLRHKFEWTFGSLPLRDRVT